ncbi:hypothetical protein A4R35_22410 [Thermogemmatispora tikiterensis]|uniref:Uncharacterized protein n=1 Tax=Thermogemmatispora tikiterensis TaxID=1825093 RepID=A0A328VRE1_9CHLR|nr:hypothetical protein A4R35_22410 [Thermogemmatispora tikiterensis]
MQLLIGSPPEIDLSLPLVRSEWLGPRQKRFLVVERTKMVMSKIEFLHKPIHSSEDTKPGCEGESQANHLLEDGLL